jgi:hypothetical protein
MDNLVKVSTPPSEVTEVEARAAGAAWPAGPDQDRGQDRADPDPVDAAGQGSQDDQTHAVDG